jgi:hypothetical protein
MSLPVPRNSGRTHSKKLAITLRRATQEHPYEGTHRLPEEAQGLSWYRWERQCGQKWDFVHCYFNLLGLKSQTRIAQKMQGFVYMSQKIFKRIAKHKWYKYTNLTSSKMRSSNLTGIWDPVARPKEALVSWYKFHSHEKVVKCLDDRAKRIW